MKPAFMEMCIILAERIMNTFRSAGATKVQAYDALSIAQVLLSSAKDLTFDEAPQVDVETVSSEES